MVPDKGRQPHVNSKINDVHLSFNSESSSKTVKAVLARMSDKTRRGRMGYVRITEGSRVRNLGMMKITSEIDYISENVEIMATLLQGKKKHLDSRYTCVNYTY